MGHVGIKASPTYPIGRRAAARQILNRLHATAMLVCAIIEWRLLILVKETLAECWILSRNAQQLLICVS